MNRRRVIVGLAVVATVVVLVVALRPRGPRPCRGTFEQVREGMTFEEVCATLGAPPGCYTSRACMPMASGLRDCREHWAADDGELIVWFEDDGRAFQVRVYEPYPNQWSWADRLRDRLGF